MHSVIDYLLFYVPLENISLIWNVTITGEGLQNLGLCSALRAFDLLWHGASVFPVSSEWPPHSVASYDTQGDAEDLGFSEDVSKGAQSKY